jgi:hypothetical protein
MIRRNIVESSYVEFVTSIGLTRKSKYWYLRSDETIVVLTLVRSPYGRQYSLAVGVVLRNLDADNTPKAENASLQSRFDRLVPSTLEHRVNDLLDLRFRMDDVQRREELLGLLRVHLVPLIAASSTLDGLRSAAGSPLVRHSVVDEEALPLLAGPP